MQNPTTRKPTRPPITGALLTLNKLPPRTEPIPTVYKSTQLGLDVWNKRSEDYFNQASLLEKQRTELTEDKSGPPVIGKVVSIIKNLNPYTFRKTREQPEKTVEEANRLAVQAEVAAQKGFSSSYMARFYSTIEGYMTSNAVKVTSVEDYIKVDGVDPTKSFITSADMAEMRGAIENITANQAPSDALMADVAEDNGLDWSGMPLEEKQKLVSEYLAGGLKPKVIPQLPHAITVEEIVKLLTTGYAGELPKPPAMPSMEEVLSIAKDMNVDETALQGYQDFYDLAKPIRDAAKEQEQQIAEVMAGIRDWQITPKSTLDNIKNALTSPIQELSKVVGVYMKYVGNPLTGLAVLTAHQLMRGTQGMEKNWEAAKARGENPWVALGTAWEQEELFGNNAANFAAKLVLGIVTDPLTFFPGWGLSIPGKIMLSAGAKGGVLRMGGEALLASNKWMWRVNNIPFDMIKTGMSKISTTLRLAAQRDGENFRALTFEGASVHTGLPFNAITPTQLHESFVAAHKKFMSTPIGAAATKTEDILISEGRYFSAFTPLDSKAIQILGALFKKKIPTEVATDMIELVNDTMREVAERIISTDDAAVRLIQHLGLDNTPEMLTVVSKYLTDWSGNIGARRIARLARLAKEEGFGATRRLWNAATAQQTRIQSLYSHSAYAITKQQTGIVAGILSAVDKLDMSKWRTVIDRFYNRPLVSAYIATPAVMFGNIIEPAISSMLEGIRPGWGTSFRYMLATQGLRGNDIRLINAAVDRAARAGEVSGILGGVGRREVSFLPQRGNPLYWFGQAFLDAQDKAGTALRWNAVIEMQKKNLIEMLQSQTVIDKIGVDVVGEMKKVIRARVPTIPKSAGFDSEKLVNDTTIAYLTGDYKNVLKMKDWLNVSNITKATQHRIIDNHSSSLGPETVASMRDAVDSGTVLTSAASLDDFIANMAKNFNAEVKTSYKQVSNIFPDLVNGLITAPIENSRQYAGLLMNFYELVEVESNTLIKIISGTADEANVAMLMGKVSKLKGIWKQGKADAEAARVSMRDSISKLEAHLKSIAATPPSGTVKWTRDWQEKQVLNEIEQYAKANSSKKFLYHGGPELEGDMLEAGYLTTDIDEAIDYAMRYSTTGEQGEAFVYAVDRSEVTTGRSHIPNLPDNVELLKPVRYNKAFDVSKEYSLAKEGILKPDQRDSVELLLSRTQTRLSAADSYWVDHWSRVERTWAEANALPQTERGAVWQRYAAEELESRIAYVEQDAVLGAESYLTKVDTARTLTKLPEPSLSDVRATGRELNAQDIAQILGGDIQSLYNSIANVAALQSKPHFTQMIMKQVNARPTLYTDITEDKVRRAYDFLVQNMGLDPELDIVLGKGLAEINAVKQRFTTLRINRTMTKAKEQKLHEYIDRVAESAKKTFGKVAGKPKQVLNLKEEVLPSGDIVLRDYDASGKATGNFIQYKLTGNNMKITGVSVWEDQTRKGLGTELYLEALSRAKANGWTVSVDLATDEGAALVRSLRDRGIIKTSKEPVKMAEDVLITDISILEAVAPKITTYQSIRQEAFDQTMRTYYQMFADYTNRSIFSQVGRMIFPFWQYEAFRLFWLSRTAVRHPATVTAWDRYYESTDQGRFNIPSVDLALNLVAGTVVGPLVTLSRRDYPNYYDSLGWVGNAIDSAARLSFFPNPAIMTIAYMSPAFTGHKMELGSILPSFHEVGLELLVASRVPGVSDLAKKLRDTVFHENFRDYYKARIIDDYFIETEGAAGATGGEIWEKIAQGIALSDEDKSLWDMAEEKVALYTTLRSMFSFVTYRSGDRDELIDTINQIYIKYGFTPELIQECEDKGVRLSDLMGGESMAVRQAFDQLEEWKKRVVRGGSTMLLPPEVQDFVLNYQQYWDDVDAAVQQRLANELDIESRFLYPTKTNKPLDTKGFKGEYSSNWDTYNSSIDFLNTQDERYSGVDFQALLDPIKGPELYYQKTGYAAPQVGPMEQLRNLYFSIELEEKPNDMGELEPDYVGFAKKRQAIVDACPPELRDDFVSWVHKNSTPLELLRDKISDTYFDGYYAISRIVKATYDEDTQLLIDEFYSSRVTLERKDEIRDEIDPTTGNKLISSYESKVTNVRVRARKDSPVLDFWLYVFGITTAPQSDSAKSLIGKFDADRTIIFRL